MLRFWSRVNTLMGHVKEAVGERNHNRVDAGLTVMGWVRLLKNAGVESNL